MTAAELRARIDRERDGIASLRRQRMHRYPGLLDGAVAAAEANVRRLERELAKRGGRR